MAIPPVAIHYRVVPARPEAHLFEVTLTIAAPDPNGQILRLPAWIPGSYMIREFARHIVRIEARAGRQPIGIEKLDKHTWRVAPCRGPLRVTCEIYAWDLSVRGAHLDTTHGFFNGTCLFLQVEGQTEHPCEVELVAPRGPAYRRWRVATAMSTAGAKAYGFGTYRAQNYDELVDHPVEMGTFSLIGFKARGVPHAIVITGRHDADLARLARDFKRLTEHQIDFFGGRAPMRRYVFLVMAVGEGYGGLEHRASTALLCSRYDLPNATTSSDDERYLRFLGLASHEYFHTWNVKRIKPAAFTPYDLTRENYTRLLWAFEGITSYYDDLCLLRCGLMSRAQYMQALGRTLTAVERGSGRLKQSVADSSFDAWVKYYRQDENAPNAIVSYYAKGALIALALDLTLRKATRNRHSLDDIMRALWTRYGKAGRGVGETEWEAFAAAVSGVRLKPFFDQALRSTRELGLDALLRAAGIKLAMAPAKSSTDRGGTPSKAADRKPPRAVLGAKTDSAGGEVRLTQVYDGGAAQAAGLSAGDILIALDGVRVRTANLDALLERHRPGDRLGVLAFRRDEVVECTLRLRAAPADTCTLIIEERVGVDARRLREQWLGHA